MFFNIRTRYSQIFFYFLSVVLSSLITGLYFIKNGFHLSYPYSYFSDALSTGILVKTMIETGWYTHNPNLAAPFVFDFSGYPLSDGATFLIMKLLSLGTPNYAVVINLFYFLTFPLTALCAMFTFQRMGINLLFSLVASLLFCFVPYHILRNAHLFLAPLYTIPLYTLLILSVIKDRYEDSSLSSKKKYFSYVGYALICVFAASSGVYYAFFAAFFLLITGIFTSIEKEKWLPLGKATLFILLISLTVLMNILPTLKYKIKPDAAQTVSRTNGEVELYGLKITQLLLPSPHNRISLFERINHNYFRTSPILNENITSSLGIIGDIGFILLLFRLFLRQRNDNQNILPNTSNNIFFNLSRLTLSGVLLATIGGFSSLFALFFTPLIRGYNRISVFIAFFSVAAFFMVLQKILKSRLQMPKSLIMLIALLILLFGLYEQLPKAHNAFFDNQASFKKDARFIDQIENLMPPKSMIMQLPIFYFPEDNSVNHKMHVYDPALAYLHSHHLRWSFGITQDQEDVLNWEKKISQKPVDEMIKQLIYAGFSGLYINRKGYPNQKLEEKITTFLNQKPLVNEDKNIIFYDLRPYAQKLRAQMTSADWQVNIKSTQEDMLMPFIRWGRGFFQFHGLNQYLAKKGRLIIAHSGNHSIPIKFKCDVSSIKKEANLLIRGSSFNETLKINPTTISFEKNLSIPPQGEMIYFQTNPKSLFSISNCTIKKLPL